MSIRRATGALLAIVLVAATGCSSSSSKSKDNRATSTTTTAPDNAAVVCAQAVTSLVSAARRYAGSFEVPPDALRLTDAEFKNAVAAANSTLVARQCNPVQTRADLLGRLAALSVRGPVADAVLRQIKARFSGTAATAATVTTLKRGTDLRDAVASLPDGSTLRIPAGVYRLDHPLVLLTGIELQGAGRNATTIVSTAGEAAVIPVTGQRVELAQLTVRHDGNAPASIVLAGPDGSVVVSGARLAGAKTDAKGQGGAGILMSGAARGAPARRGTTLEITDAELRDNAAAGIELARGHRASIVRGDFVANGQCGVCFLDGSSGSVQDSRFDGNAAGIAVTGNAAPALLRLTITGGQVGLQAGDRAAPAVKTASISGARRAAIIYSGYVTGSLDDVTCSKVTYGLVLGPATLPQLGTVNCAVVRSR